jgi:hypothetical protein
MIEEVRARESATFQDVTFLSHSQQQIPKTNNKVRKAEHHLPKKANRPSSPYIHRATYFPTYQNLITLWTATNIDYTITSGIEPWIFSLRNNMLGFFPPASITLKKKRNETGANHETNAT